MNVGFIRAYQTVNETRPITKKKYELTGSSMTCITRKKREYYMTCIFLPKFKIILSVFYVYATGASTLSCIATQLIGVF
jgi:hypothetical protein